ncbi:uroporphyrinogen-III synthase [Leucobacter sp. cx-42]|uniref:uroporphyrinogen-III synthase n=1 Tax=unclassified Leucobacter TaxID=2621730 RepID=UPI00165EBD03|nr:MULTISPECIES: uroporphyrinogen-III synthase [unclassified Leucobacter]MBC9955123.1 uroporphyrinogen-III synthase [Leucobacter sp. cx-42]
MSNETKPLSGLRVLVPRGGTWGELVSQALRERGAQTVISPLVDFAHTSEEETLVQNLQRLEAGDFDWMTATSATVADVLKHHGAVIHENTKVALVGEATAVAFRDAGYPVDFTPDEFNNTTHQLLKEWKEIDEDKVLKVLTLRSDVARPVLTEGLISRGHDVSQVLAFRTVGVPAGIQIREDVESGHINAILVASPKIAVEVEKQFPERPATTILACVGPDTIRAAEELGLRSPDVVNSEQQQVIADAVEATIDHSDMLD